MKLSIFGNLKSRIRGSIQQLLERSLPNATEHYYQSIRLSPEELASEAFKQNLGGRK